MTKEYKPIGNHATLDIKYVDGDQKTIFYLLNSTDLMGLLALMVCELGKFSRLSVIKERFKPQGVSVVLLLKESHISIHTYPEHRSLMMDIFTCGDSSPYEAIGIALDFLGMFGKTEIAMNRMERGIPE